jgi:RHS repeat-associated protein
MKFSFISILLLLPILAISQSSDQNWVKTKTYKVPTSSAVAAPTPAQAVTQVSYFDGLGRATQQVAHAQSNTGKDIVTHITYDAFGRQTKEFLPYANQNASLNYNASAESDITNFYSSYNGGTQFPYSEKQFEASPLNRVLKQAAPGDAWSMGSGKEIKLDYQTNTADDVKLYKATATWNATLGVYDIALSQTGNFVENQLYKTITYDENSPGGISKIGRTEEYKDKEGKVILKRTFNNSIAHETYYVYDTFGNLSYVIPPLVTNVSTELDGLCYQYKYDYRNRLVEKKLPGKHWEYIVYDKLDRVVATGPAYNPWVGSDSDNGWLITKYDAFNRPVYTGWYDRMATATSSDRKIMQAMIDGNEIISENKSTATVTIDGVAIKYTNQVIPSLFVVLTVNYYDNYDYPNAPSIPSQIEGQNTQSTNLKGMATGSWVRVLDAAEATTNETTYIVYDTRYRPIRSYTKNYLGGYTQVDSKLDWSGKTLYTVSLHQRTASGQLFTVKERFTYTEQDRLLKHTHEIVGALPEQLLTLNTYDELGQLVAKNVGGTDITGTLALQKVNYKYNIRGWLTAINDVNNLMPSATDRDLFAFKINYNKKEDDTAGLFNGNISETLWRTSADNTKRKYAYNYDNLNRLLEANYSKPEDQNTLDNYLEKLSYDKAGNILTLERNGNLDPSGGAPVNQIDNLEYSYHPENKNQLLKVNDLSNSPQGFKDNYASTENDFSYDNNGNMTVDNNKDIERIIYNHLNLPIKINFGAKGNIYYLYNAIGGKVKKVVEDNVAHITTTTDYLSSFQYKNAELQFFPHAEGYVHYTKPLQMDELGAFNYVFNYTDHLGNVRLSYARDPLVRNRVKILEENHYYAFGLKHKNYNVEHLDFDQFPETGVELVPIPVVANASYNLKYNGKELQKELELNMYDYGARNYDPALGRWMNMDNLSGKWSTYSPYNYVINNPINLIDPNGEDVYLFYYVKSDNKRDNSMFWNSVLTHVNDLLKSDEFGDGDIAVYESISDLGGLEKDVEDNISKLSPKYGKTKEFGIWSHAGLDGPIGSSATSKNALYNQGDTLADGSVASGTSTQLNMKGWGSINFNWKNDGTSSANFFGCNTGRDPDGKGAKKSFTGKLSSLANFNDVNVGGQPKSSYPSMYANIRETNSAMRSGNFTNQTTYMVASSSLLPFGRWQPNYAYPMSISRNGKTLTPHYQIGDNK